MAHTDHKESMKCKENLVQKEQEKHTWGTRKFDTSAIVENIVTYLKDRQSAQLSGPGKRYA